MDTSQLAKLVVNHVVPTSFFYWFSHDEITSDLWPHYISYANGFNMLFEMSLQRNNNDIYMTCFKRYLNDVNRSRHVILTK